MEKKVETVTMVVLGDYEYNPSVLLGHGAFAVVYKGRHRKKHFPVAIKCITKLGMSKAQNLLTKEIHILKKVTELKHENVVALFDCKQSGDGFHLIMEYCNGGDLSDYLTSKRNLSEETVRLFVRQLARAMKAFHNLGIVHRDLKPQNILLSHKCKTMPPPSKITLKIADFGFARILHDGNMAATLCGSPMYMAPEVIMSLQYDARADLWSLGTIIYQCLTGHGPFSAQTPTALKIYYEEHNKLVPKLSKSYSPELCDLLLRLLERNADDRITFEDFFNHIFLQGKKIATSPGIDIPASLPMGTSPPTKSKSSLQQHIEQEQQLQLQKQKQQQKQDMDPDDDIPDDNAVSVVENPANCATITNVGILCESENNTESIESRYDDGFVLVPKNLPVDPNVIDYEKKHSSKQQWPAKAAAAEKIKIQSNSPRPSTLPISEPKPVPAPVRRYSTNSTQGAATAPTDKNPVRYRTISEQASAPKLSTTAPTVSPAQQIPRSQPINVKGRKEQRKSSFSSDINSISPPAVKFAIGTPPTGRHRTVSGGSLSETPPNAPYAWQLTPSGQTQSPLRRSGHSSPVIMNALAKLQTPGSPTLMVGPGSIASLGSGSSGENNNQRNMLSQQGFGPRALGPRAFTLPELGATGGLHSLLDTNATGTVVNPSDNHDLDAFLVPELSEETLMDREHNEILSKLNFVLALTDCIQEVADSRSAPLSSLVNGYSNERQSSPPHSAEHCKLTERLVLLVRALQLLSSGLNLAVQEFRSGKLKRSTNVRNAFLTMNSKYRAILTESKKLIAGGILENAKIRKIKADVILYDYAVNMCQAAALDELLFNSKNCFERYNTAHIIIHSLLQQVNIPVDKVRLNRMRENVERRLSVLQKRGIIYATGEK